MAVLNCNSGNQQCGNRCIPNYMVCRTKSNNLSQRRKISKKNKNRIIADLKNL